MTVVRDYCAMLGVNQYGKAETHLVRVVRDDDVHELRDLLVSVALSGAFEDVHVHGDNSAVLQGGGIFSVGGVVTITTSPVTANHSVLIPGGIYRNGGTMTVTVSPVTANTPTNCTGSPSPVPGCIG